MLNTEPAAVTLRRDILAAIEPWRESYERPPYTGIELVVMALAVSDMPLNEIQITTWIRGTFDCYQLRSRSGIPQIELDRAFIGTDIPGPKSWHRTDSWAGWIWSIDPYTARDYLQNTLGLEPNTPFPFLKLPGELRNSIYELALCYSRSGVRPTYNFHKDTTEFQAFIANSTLPFSIDRWAAGRPSPLQMRLNTTKHSLDKLNLLLVNRQIFEEAMPIFYNINTLYFSNVSYLAASLWNMSPHRRQHLRKIGFSYSPSEERVVNSAFRYLASIPDLRKLYIDTDDNYWTPFAHKPQDGEPMGFKIPGLEVHRSIRGLKEVAFSSKCPRIAAQLKPEMEAADTKKRKRSDIQLSGHRRHARAVKSTRLRYA